MWRPWRRESASLADHEPAATDPEVADHRPLLRALKELPVGLRKLEDALAHHYGSEDRS